MSSRIVSTFLDLTAHRLLKLKIHTFLGLA